MLSWKGLLKRIFGTLLYEHLCFFYQHRYWPDMANPKTFAERVVVRKLFHVPHSVVALADKIAVRDYVAQRAGSQYLTQLYWAGDDVDAIDWDSLPQQFVAKAAHASGSNFIVFVDDKAKANKEAIIKKLRWMLRQRYGEVTSELFYLSIPPRILIEERLVDKQNNIPQDYKISVFHGVAQFLHVDIDRYGDHRRNFYDRAWRLLPIKLGFPQGGDLPRPKQFDGLLALSETLAQGFDFVRIDLYCIDDKRIVFGEMTFTPSAGRDRYEPYASDVWMGKLWGGEEPQ